MTVHEWILHHIDHLTGLRRSTLCDYRSYLKNDIDDALGDLPLTSPSRDNIARWLNVSPHPHAEQRLSTAAIIPWEGGCSPF